MPFVMISHTIFITRSYAVLYRGFKSISSQKAITNPLQVRNLSSLPNSPLFKALIAHDPSSTAVVHSQSGRSFTYGNLVHDVVAARARLNHGVHRSELAGQRIAFLVENSYDYVVTLLSIIASDAIALPIAATFPDEEIRYIIGNSGARTVLSTHNFQKKVDKVLQLLAIDNVKSYQLAKIEVGADSSERVQLDDGCVDNGGLMLYTSGTTSRPKGVVLSTSVITAQAKSLIEAWKYRTSDLLLHVLPLHHIHGTINALCTPLMAGSTIEFAFPFNPDTVWHRLAAPFLSSSRTSETKPVTFFTVVPTIYSKLLSSHATLDQKLQSAARTAISPQNLRLNISGSAALPTPIKDAWASLSGGNVLLERYGMTEVGMALSCGLDFADRVDASVGWPLPSVEVRLVDTETGAVIEAGEEVDANGQPREGEVQLRGPTVFSGYWQNPTATATDFVESDDGKGKWFKTGDVAVRQSVPTAGKSVQPWTKGPMYFIRGRESVDIIKTGGEKISALEVERELLSLPQVAEAAVIGIHSDHWGQKIAAIVVLQAEAKHAGKSGRPWGAMDMRRALKDRLASHKIPQHLKVVDNIPRNAMGKINKKSLAQDIYAL